MSRTHAALRAPNARRSTCARRAGSTRSRATVATDLAELRAHHYASALELVEASGGDSAELVGPAVDAADRRRRSAPMKLFAFAQVERYASRALDARFRKATRGGPQALLALAAAEAELGNAEFHEHATEAAAAFCALDDRRLRRRSGALVGELAVELRSPRRAHARQPNARLALVGDAGVSREQVARRLQSTRGC